MKKTEELEETKGNIGKEGSNIKVLKKSHTLEINPKKLKKVLPPPPPPTDLMLFWKCRFCTFVNTIDPLTTNNQCRICETVQEVVKEKELPIHKEITNIDFDIPAEFALNSSQCSQCGYKFMPESTEFCQCGYNLSHLNDFLNTSLDETLEPEVKGKLGIELVEANGVKGGAINVKFWHPTAKKVRFLGDFNKFGATHDFNPKKYKMNKDEAGVFSLSLEAAPGTSFIGQRFKYYVEKSNGKAEWRNDPRSVMFVGKKFINDIIYDHNAFKWNDHNHKPPPINSLIIYETYIQALAGNKAEGAFLNALKKLDYLKKLGINAIELIPITQDAHERCWGYDPISLFAVHQTYGSADDLKIFINECHKRGISVIIDWVPNHICKMTVLHSGYFYPKDDERHETRYGPRPDFGNPRVKEYLNDSLRSWLEEFHFDGVRVDSVESMRIVSEENQKGILDAWTYCQEMTTLMRKEFPDRILIAEDLQNDHRVNGIMGFDSQWDTYFFSVMLNAAKAYDDSSRNIYEIAMAMKSRFEATGFGRIIYSESHDTVCEDRQFRIIKAVNPENKVPDLLAKRRSRLVGACAFVAVGIPMLMAGQELMEMRGGIWPEIAPIPEFNELEDLTEEERNSYRFFSDLIRLRTNIDGFTKGLTGSNIAVIHIHPSINVPVLAVHRWDKGGPRDDVVVVMNFSNTSFKKEGYWIHFPRPGVWNIRLCSEGGGYGFSEKPKGTKFQVNVSTVYDEKKNDGYMFAGRILLKKYTIMILSQD